MFKQTPFGLGRAVISRSVGGVADTSQYALPRSAPPVRLQRVGSASHAWGSTPCV